MKIARLIITGFREKLVLVMTILLLLQAAHCNAGCGDDAEKRDTPLPPTSIPGWSQSDDSKLEHDYLDPPSSALAGPPDVGGMPGSAGNSIWTQSGGGDSPDGGGAIILDPNEATYQQWMVQAGHQGNEMLKQDITKADGSMDADQIAMFSPLLRSSGRTGDGQPSASPPIPTSPMRKNCPPRPGIKRQRLHPVLSNLLPEGALREMFAEMVAETVVLGLKAHIDDEFQLLSYLGRDLPGALIATPMAVEAIPAYVLHDESEI